MSEEFPPCICGKPGAYKVYHLPTRLECDQQLKGHVCEECFKLMGEKKIDFAKLTEERLNKERRQPK